MFSKKIIGYGTYVKTVFSKNLYKKYTNLEMKNIQFYQKDGIGFCKSFCSSCKDSSEDKPPGNRNQLISSQDRTKLEKWIEMVRYDGMRVPENISEEHFLELYRLQGKYSRLNYLNFLFKKEIAKAKSKDRLVKLKELHIEKRKERESKPKEHIDYFLWKCSMFTKTNKSQIMSLLNTRLVNAMKYGQPLVIDLNFYNHMKAKEVKSLAQQLKICINENRLSSNPFNLMLCNVDFDCEKFQVFTQKYMPNVLKPSFPMMITSKSYLDLFPKEKLIYLTPDAKHEMKTFDHNAIYIIGGLVDLGAERPLTLAKTKEENIQALRFPVKRYHILRRSDSFAIHVLLNILLDLQENGDWKKAFKNIPRRLIMTGDEFHLDPYAYGKKKFKN